MGPVLLRSDIIYQMQHGRPQEVLVPPLERRSTYALVDEPEEDVHVEVEPEDVGGGSDEEDDKDVDDEGEKDDDDDKGDSYGSDDDGGEEDGDGGEIGEPVDESLFVLANIVSVITSETWS